MRQLGSRSASLGGDIKYHPAAYVTDQKHETTNAVNAAWTKARMLTAIVSPFHDLKPLQHIDLSRDMAVEAFQIVASK